MALHEYKLRDGTGVPSVTTILSRFKESGALINWAWKQGKAGLDYRETRDRAANSGTVAHTLVERHIKNEPLGEWGSLNVPPEVEEKGRSAFEAYRTWERHSRLKIMHTEVSLVSERYRFGGTLDAIGLLDGLLCLLDWKSSNGIYMDYAIQVAAYKALWEENRPGELLTGGYHICRFSKNDDDFEHRYFGKLPEAWELFKTYLRAYDLNLLLKKRIR